MKELYYHYKGETNSNCVYVTLQKESMDYLILRATKLLATYAELTATKDGEFLTKEKSKKLFGTRRSHIANNRMSLLGGLIHNYYKKANPFTNDISEGQLPYITNVINECHNELNEEEIVFKLRLFY